MLDKILGQTLHGTYRIERLIGQGGMGAVFEATHLRLKHRFAVKLLFQTEDMDEERKERFRREAQITATLHHPHIVEVTDFNFNDRWGPYLVLELLDGESLQNRLSSTAQLSFGQVSSILTQAASALEVSHQHGIVHRDLKPSNIFLCRVGDRTDFVKLLDFGIAKVLGGLSIVTRENIQLGTCIYMSPEQIVGPDVDWASDQFSMGCIIYRMLAGRPPFMADTEAAILYQIENKDPPPLETFIPELPEQAAEVLYRSLEKRPDKRFSSMLEMAESFARAVSPCTSGSSTELQEKRLAGKSLEEVDKKITSTKTKVTKNTATERVSTAPPAPPPSLSTNRWVKKKSFWFGAILLCGSGAFLLVQLTNRVVISNDSLGGAKPPENDASLVRKANHDLMLSVTDQKVDPGEIKVVTSRSTHSKRKVVQRTAHPLPQPPGPRARAVPVSSRHYEMRCRQGKRKACIALGNHFRRLKDKDLAIAAYFRACTLKSAKGCFRLARIYERQKDFDSAKFSITQACEMKLPRACAYLAAMYLDGKLGGKNVVRARKYFARACGMSSATGCYKLGRMYCDGGDLPRNNEACTTHLKKGCRLGSRHACSYIRSLGQRKTP